MLWDAVQQFGNKIYGININPYKGRYAGNTLILGFDTEYTSKDHELLSIQLANNKDSKFFEVEKDFSLNPDGKITVDEFRRLLRLFYSYQKTSLAHKPIILYSYWSIAELQHFIMNHDIKINENPFTYSMEIQKNHNMRIVIQDLFVWYQEGLSKFAKSLLNKDKKEYSTADITKDDLLKPDFKEYAKYDAELCYEIATLLRERFYTLFDVDMVLTETAARTASAAFRKHYISEVLYQDNCDVRRQAMLSNWGGSSIAYERGIFKEPIYYYDGVSMFPSCAIELKFLPTGEDWFEVTDIKDYQKIDGICKVKFKFPDNENYPNLLTVPKHPFTRQIFPLEGISHTTGKEIKYALELGADIELLYGYGYETGITAFSDFEKDMVAKKQQAKVDKNIVDTFVYKLMGNSIIGKTKQSIYKSDINELIEGIEKFGTGFTSTEPKHLSTGGIFMPEWNTLILGFARSIGLKSFKKTKALIGTVDSAITRQDLGQTFEIDNIVYERKFSGHEAGILRAKGYYVLANNPQDNHIAHHGYAGKPQDYIELVKIGINLPFVKYKKYRPVKLRSSLRRDLTFGEFRPITLIYDTSFDNARLLHNDGTTEPFKNIKEYITIAGKRKKDHAKTMKYAKLPEQTYFRNYTNEP